MKKIKSVYIDVAMYGGFNVHVEVIQQSKDGSRILVLPIAGDGSFEINRHQLRETFRNS